MNVQLRDHSAVSVNSFVSPASYWVPGLMAVSAWIEHAPFGFWIMGELKPRSIVELGVHHGFSYYVLCRAAQRLQLDARCFAIDTWTGDEHAGYYGDDVYDNVRSHNRRYEAFSRLIRSDFSEARGQFADGSIDLLHIDGCHTYEAARHDFESWLPKMSKRGVVLFHDIAEYENGFGVYRLWEEIRGRYPHFEFRHGHGLGVVGVGDSTPIGIRQLFEASACAASAQAVRAIYARLGLSVGHMRRLAEQSDEITALAQQVHNLAQQVRSQEAVIGSYEASTSWRLTAPLRKVAGIMKSASGVAGNLRDTLRDAATTPGSAVPAYRPDHQTS